MKMSYYGMQRHTKNMQKIVTQCCIQKMWLGGQTESFQNVGGGEGVYNVLTFQKSRGGKSSPRGANPPLNETLIEIDREIRIHRERNKRYREGKKTKKKRRNERMTSRGRRQTCQQIDRNRQKGTDTG